jgi:pimeloyl-ACP methyl ester carboxylesterase
MRGPLRASRGTRPDTTARSPDALLLPPALGRVLNAIARVRHCASRDGTRLAFTIDGGGFPPVVKVAQWFATLGDESDSLIATEWVTELGRRNALIRYDQRGFGLSERAPARVSLDAWVEDLEAVVDASGHVCVVLFAASQGVPVAVRYAARHPGRVLALFAWGGVARGPGRRGDPSPSPAVLDAAVERARDGWDDPATFRALFSSRLAQGADAATLDAIDRSHRTLCDGAVAADSLRAWFDLDVEADARRVRCPVRVVRAEGDVFANAAEAARLASAIPAGSLSTVAGTRHMPLPGDAGAAEAHRLLHETLDECGHDLALAVPRLTARQLEVLRWVAYGLTDREIAERLGLSSRTVGDYVSGALRLLRARNRDEAVRLAAARGLLG